MDGLDGNTIAIIVVMLVESLVFCYFWSRRLAAMEKRLMEDLSGLRREISGLRLDIRAMSIRPRPRKSVEASDRRFDEINRRIDETNAEMRTLINDVGVVKGALGVSTQSRERELVSAE